jgi:polygalacturonase
VAPLIGATGVKNIAITGKGEIDGRGRELVKNLLQLLQQGIVQDEQWKTKRPAEKNRPYIIGCTGCTGVTIKGIIIKNGAGWVQDYRNCKSVTIDSITVNSTEYWNNDGIDIVNSQQVIITNSYIDAADDAICLKSEGAPGSCEKIMVANCTLRSSASAFKLGTGSSGGFRDIIVRNLTVFNTYRSAIALEAVDGGFLENIDIKNVQATNTGNAVFIRLGHRNNSSAYSTVKNISIAGVHVQVPAGKPDAGYPVEGPLQKFSHNTFPASIVGLPQHPVQNVVLKDITIQYEGGGSRDKAYFGWDSVTRVPENENGYPEFSMFGELPAWGLYVRHVEGLTLENVQLQLQQPDYRPACIFDDVAGLRLQQVNIPFCNTQPVILFNSVSNPVVNSLKLPVEESRAVKIQ